MTGETDFSDELPPDDSPPPESFETAKPVAKVEPKVEPSPKPAARAPEPRQEARIISRSSSAVRQLPHSLEAEEQLLSCCLLDGSDTIARCLEAHLQPSAFFNHQNRLIYEWAVNAHAHGMPVDLQIMAEDLRSTGKLEAVGGITHLVKVSSLIGTTAQAGYFIDRVRETHIQRELIKLATGAIENAYQCNGNLIELLADTTSRISKLGTHGVNGIGYGLADFKVPAQNDRSILLGNRFLNRGDGGVLVSTSGMGKSSMSLQASVEWALGQDFMGIKPNGPLTSLIIQSEDSDGDIGEVWASIQHAKKLREEDKTIINQRVIIKSERVARGQAFLANLRRMIGKHKPDLVWINPLQAFMEGDVTDSQDLSAFLRGGLNALNEPASFGYIIVHHTTKPATGKDREDRLWHEVMYDMAGGAEIINWARFIISLRATPTHGQFTLELAKRGRRAGVTKMVDSGAGWRDEPVTSIPIKHSEDRIKIPGQDRDMPVIFWETREATAEEKSGPKPKAERSGAPEKYPFSDYRSIFPAKIEPGEKTPILHRRAQAIFSISKSSFDSVIKRYESSGLIERVLDEQGVVRWRLSI